MRKSKRRIQKRPTFGYAKDESAVMRQVQEPLPTIAEEQNPEKMQRNEEHKKIAKVEEGRLISEGF